MTFDPTQPTDTTKLRNIGTVIRPNWSAINTGDASFLPQAINLVNRTSVPVASDPTAIANTYILYCKANGAGHVVLYGIDPNSVITQIGNYVAPSSAQSGYSWLAGGMLIQWGQSAVASGTNTISFPIAFSGTAYSVTITPFRSNSNVDQVYLSPGTISSTQFGCRNTSSAGITSISWIAIGPKL